MNKSRLEAFSDGVLAIIITIMVLEIKVPHGHEWADLKPLLPVAVSYVISFAMVGIYWGNHHHLLQAARQVNGRIILANLLLLFSLSLLPFATAWMGENHFAPNTITLYAVVFICCGLSWIVLQSQIVPFLPKESPVRLAFARLWIKSCISTGCALAAIPLGYVYPAASAILFVIQSVIWLKPDLRLEKALMHGNKNEAGQE